MKNFVLTLLVSAFATPLAAQVSYSEKSAIGHEVWLEYKMAVDDIDEADMQCDTMIYRRHGAEYLLKALYFDGWAGLRKYVTENRIDDGASEHFGMSAYYDGEGKLFCIYSFSGNNCESLSELYFVTNGKILCYNIDYYCDCCDNDDGLEEHMATIRPEVGGPVKLAGSPGSLDNFLHAERLLSRLRSEYRILSHGPEFGSEEPY